MFSIYWYYTWREGTRGSEVALKISSTWLCDVRVWNFWKKQKLRKLYFMVFSPGVHCTLRCTKLKKGLIAWSYIISKEDKPAGVYKQDQKQKGIRVNPLRKDPDNLRSADLLKECGQD